LCAHGREGRANRRQRCLARSKILRLSARARRAKTAILCGCPCLRRRVAGRDALCFRRDESHTIAGSA
jgi:hypothetical protein